MFTDAMLVFFAILNMNCSWFSDLGPNGGHQPHRCHVRAADGLDLLDVLVTLFVHELQNS